MVCQWLRLPPPSTSYAWLASHRSGDFCDLARQQSSQDQPPTSLLSRESTRGKRATALLLILLGFLPVELLGQGGAEATGIGLLNVPIGARAVGMGGVSTSRSGSLESLLYNPAGVGSVKHLHLGLSYLDASNFRQGYFAGAVPVTPLGVLGLSVKHFAVEEQELIGPTGPQGTFSPHATELCLTLARRLGERISFGASLSLADVQLAPPGLFGSMAGQVGFRGGGTTLGGDLGVLASPLEAVPVSLGASLLSLGSGIRFFEDGAREPLPRRLRLGASIEIMQWLASTVSQTVSLLVAFDTEQPLVGGAQLDRNIQHAGVELGILDLAYLRTGLTRDPLDSETSVSLGLGLRVGGTSLDLARLVQGNALVTEETYLSMDVSF